MTGLITPITVGVQEGLRVLCTALFGSETSVLHKVLPQRAAEARCQGSGVVFSNALSPL